MIMQDAIRNNWTIEEIYEIYNTPLLELVFKAANVHKKYNDTAEVQVCTLLSIKTGGCTEDCAYCPQAARYNTGVNVHALMKQEEVLSYAQKANMPAARVFAWAPPGVKCAITAILTACWKW